MSVKRLPSMLLGVLIWVPLAAAQDLPKQRFIVNFAMDCRDRSTDCAKINAALHEWERHTTLEFRSSMMPDLIITFDRHDECPWGFDGGYAHAEMGGVLRGPVIGRFLHFNPATDWTKVDVYKVALHEIGHLLGLPHISREPYDQIMSAYYGNGAITQDDLDDLPVEFRPDCDSLEHRAEYSL